jgi:hypothetical protein
MVLAPFDGRPLKIMGYIQTMSAIYILAYAVFLGRKERAVK